MERLQKVIAQSGITSRRKAEQLIVDGRVRVNYKVVTKLGTKVGPSDVVEVDHVPIERENKVYYLLYKPRGYVSTVSDDKNRDTVVDLLPEVTERIYPVGRLDYASSGILILTNDGEFAHLLMHPKHEIEKVYVAKIKGTPERAHLEQLRKGVREGRDLLKVNHYRILSTDKKAQTTIIQLKLHEGKNRHIRRMMEALGYPILKLKREKYGFLTLSGLSSGQYRPLKREEIHHLTQLALENVEL